MITHLQFIHALSESDAKVIADAAPHKKGSPAPPSSSSSSATAESKDEADDDSSSTNANAAAAAQSIIAAANKPKRPRQPPKQPDRCVAVSVSLSLLRSRLLTLVVQSFGSQVRRFAD